MDIQQLKLALEACLMAAGEPLSFERLLSVFPIEYQPKRSELSQALQELMKDYAERSFELVELASGYCFRVRQEYSNWVARLLQERPQRYSRALLETLAIIAYRQPVTRAEIEAIRGVNVSSQVLKLLLDRNWIVIVGHKDVPGKPSLYATTKMFLDHFSLKTLEELPALDTILNLEQQAKQLEIELSVMAETDSQAQEVI